MEPFIGMVVQFGGNFAPRGWALCNGQLLPINSNSALFSILGTTYGGDGRSTFGLPDLRGRAAIHDGTGPGLSPYRLGQKGGHESVTMTVNQMPSHNHSFEVTAGPPNAFDPIGALACKGATPAFDSSGAVAGSMKSTAISQQGGGQPVDVRQPYQVLNFIIALQGTYPSRN